MPCSNQDLERKVILSVVAGQVRRATLFYVLVCALSFALPVDMPSQTPVFPERQIAQEEFGADAPWYLENIPFLEIDDSDIQRTYYYRWKVYRSHFRQIGTQGVDETEFLSDVPWARQPYTDLNDSSSFHILEGRWLRNPALLHSLVDHLYTGGGNDRHFSESIAAATLAWTQVTGDPQPALDHLDTMEGVYSLWDDHFDAQRGLYWIEPLEDATEYTIASIDASGAGFLVIPSTNQKHNGFTGGYAFRPSINAYQFANALAISQFASLAGKPIVARMYADRAASLRLAVLSQLWDPAFTHFTDVYQRSTPFVQQSQHIRGRELVGFVPWMYGLVPPDNPGQPDFTLAWRHALDPTELGGTFGLRTVEPTYPHYLQQYRYDAQTGLPECQWNGPAWPFQISQALTGMANLLQDSHQHIVTKDDYLRLLRQYTRLHGDSARVDLQEDYNPDTGKPIVGLPRSHHYNHSTYNDLILSGLVGIRPHTEDILELNPLLPDTASTELPIRYFALLDLRYHDRNISLIYDAEGTHYHSGSGLSVFASGNRIYGPAPLKHISLSLVEVPKQNYNVAPGLPVDLAVNVWERPPSPAEIDLPIASASSTAAGSSVYQAIDGRLWFFPEVVNGWSPAVNAKADPHTATDSWFALDLRHPREVNRLELAFFAEANHWRAPSSLTVQFYQHGGWHDARKQRQVEPVPVANGITHISFAPTTVKQLRLLIRSPALHQIRLIELEAYGTKRTQ